MPLTPACIDLELTPPVAKIVPSHRTYHGKTLTDDYFWLKDQGYPKVDDRQVLDYLNSENAYFEAAFCSFRGLENKVFAELRARVQEDDASVPFRDGQWFYHWRFAEGGQYRTWYRQPTADHLRPTGKEGDAEIILDLPALAHGLEFFKLGGWSVSPDGKLLAYAVDTDGSERFTIKIRDLHSGKELVDAIPQTVGEPVWAANSSTLLYLEVSEQWRPYRVRAHALGQDRSQDAILYEEKDTAFFVSLHKTTSGQLLVINSGDHVTNEVRILAADTPLAQPTLIASRQTKLEYYVGHQPAATGPGTLYIRTNDRHKNFRVVKAPVASPSPEQWQEVIGGSDDVYIRGIHTFRDFFVVEEGVKGLDQIRIRAYTGEEHHVPFPELAYAVSLGPNTELASDHLRLHYQSMVTPGTVYDYHLADRTLERRKVVKLPSGYQAEDYHTERLMAPARDGKQIPVSIVYRKGFRKDGRAPLHLYSYGAYGNSTPPSFSSNRLSLLDRGFAYAIAHIRGGDEMGYHWYEEGKLFQRTNTFHDFVDVAKFLVRQGYVSAGRISASGGSAGGELMGAVVNDAPQLWAAVVAHVPFVDVLNTMLDKDLPLTPIEWPEWGNPITSEEAYDYILSYSPYDQVKAQDYPPMMITAGLNDPRVTYWEPAKWVAKLRALKTDSNLLLLKTNMGAGHAGKSGRFKRLRETAEEYAFILRAFGVEG